MLIIRKALSLLTLAALCLPVAGAPRARESVVLAATDPVVAARRQVAPTPEGPRNDAAMQAICKEVMVDTDEGYGVSRRESRFVCEQSR
jgi:hypothetical protein